MIKAVLFDMDGVLIDTEKYYNKFGRQAAEELGCELSFETACRLRSLTRELSASLLEKELGSSFDYEAMRKRRRELVNRQIADYGIEKKPYVEETVRRLRKQGYRIAVVTATEGTMAREQMRLAGIDGLFEEIVSASMVSRGKPYPDVYLYACRSLGLVPEECAAVEDSPNGVESAYKAGCRVIMVPDLTGPDEVSLNRAEKVCRSLREVESELEDIETCAKMKSAQVDFEQAKQAFENYLDGYDRTDDKINLKIVHTYGVVTCAEEIARRMGLTQEDIMLAKLIGLLHDIGRFEQLRRYNSFLPETMNHAKYGAELLFEEGMIRQFVKEEKWDAVIRTAIDCHSDFAIQGVTDERTLLHAQIIRDADKLDNCRVKLEERTETLLALSPEETGVCTISESVWQGCLDGKSVLASERKTPMDYWVSYVAYFYDIYFKETMQIILEQNYIARIIGRIPYSNPDTAEKMKLLEEMLRRHAEEMTGKKSV